MKQGWGQHGAVPKETSKQTGHGAGTSVTPAPKSAVCGETADANELFAEVGTQWQ